MICWLAELSIVEGIVFKMWNELLNSSVIMQLDVPPAEQSVCGHGHRCNELSLDIYAVK